MLGSIVEKFGHRTQKALSMKLLQHDSRSARSSELHVIRSCCRGIFIPEGRRCSKCFVLKYVFWYPPCTHLQWSNPKTKPQYLLEVLGHLLGSATQWFFNAPKREFLLYDCLCLAALWCLADRSLEPPSFHWDMHISLLCHDEWHVHAIEFELLGCVVTTGFTCATSNKCLFTFWCAPVARGESPAVFVRNL